jgi:hypothetical protein
MTFGRAVLTTSHPARIIAGTLLALGLFAAAWATRPAKSTYRLDLNVTRAQYAVYFSAWDDGPVYLDHDAGTGGTVVFHREFTWVDGCSWRSTEVLRPLGSSRYRYEYDEDLVSCPEGAVPNGVNTPREGIVTVERVAGEHELTTLEGTSTGRHWEALHAPRHRCQHQGW